MNEEHKEKRHSAPKHKKEAGPTVKELKAELEIK